MPFLVLSVVALLLYTFGVFFLVFAPAGVYLSPGEETVKDNSLNASVTLLIFTAVALMFMFLQKKNYKESSVRKLIAPPIINQYESNRRM